jgi:hypothetical protein
LLVYFLESEVHSGENSAAPYREPVECGIAWINGEELSIGCVEDVKALHQLQMRRIGVWWVLAA